MADTLKPCSHCKAQAQIASNRDWHHLNVPAHHYNNCIFDHTIATVPATDENLEWLKKQWNTRPIEDELVEALVGYSELVIELQSIAINYLQPNGLGTDPFIGKIIELLDNPEERQLTDRAHKALSKAKGTHNE